MIEPSSINKWVAYYKRQAAEETKALTARLEAVEAAPEATDAK